MRISTKGRYAIAAMIHLAQNYNNNEYITVISISENLDISKIYLEQVFSLLKRGGLVTSIKGSRGGYMLTRNPESISVFEILSSIEGPLFEETKETISDKSPEIEAVMRSCVFNPLDQAVQAALKSIPLQNLVEEVQKHNKESGYMFYI